MENSRSWLVAGLVRDFRALGATADDESLQDEAESVIGAWSTRGRSFHNITYLAELMNRLDQFSDSIAQPASLRVATCYHGLEVHDGSSDSYAHCGLDCGSSAVSTRERLGALGIPVSVIERIVYLIGAATGNDTSGSDNDTAILSDVMKLYLADQPQDYRANLDKLHEEYSSLSELEFRRGRLARVKGILQGSAVFQSNACSMFETAAQQNLEAELYRLNQTLGYDETDVADTGSIETGQPDSTSTDTTIIRSQGVAETVGDTVKAADEMPAEPDVKPAAAGPAKPVMKPVSEPTLKTAVQPAAESAGKPVSKPASGIELKPDADSEDDEASSMEAVADMLDTLTMKKVVPGQSLSSR